MKYTDKQLKQTLDLYTKVYNAELITHEQMCKKLNIDIATFWRWRTFTSKPYPKHYKKLNNIINKLSKEL